MKLAKDITKQALVFSLLVLYVFIVLSYMKYLPQAVRTAPLNTSLNNVSLQKNNPSNASVILHRSFKCILETKRKTIVPAFKPATFLTLPLFFKFTAAILSIGVQDHLVPVQSVLKRYADLVSRSLKFNLTSSVLLASNKKGCNNLFRH